MRELGAGDADVWHTPSDCQFTNRHSSAVPSSGSLEPTLTMATTAASRNVTYIEYVEFRGSLEALHKKGGRFQKAARDVRAILDIAHSHPGMDPFHGIPVTKHGETRVDHAVKYDLQGDSRLVTVQTNGFCVFLYCGDHNATDKWLESNRGITPVVDKNNRAVITFKTPTADTSRAIATHDGHHVGPLFSRLPEDDFDFLVKDLDRKLVRRLEAVQAEIAEGKLWELVAAIDDGDRRQSVYEVFAMLKANRVTPAIARIRELRGDMMALVDAPPIVVPDIVDSQFLRRINPRDPTYSVALERFMKSARYRDWMTFLHPDQEAIVDEDFSGPAKLAGVSGSGKTCVVVRRAVRLATRYPKDRILVVTLNRSLATLIDELVSVCAGENERDRIDVLPFFSLCRQMLLESFPDRAKVLEERTWKTEEHVDDIWSQFYRCENNNYDARCLQEVHDSLLARRYDPERYLREEFDWIRSALPRRDRLAYKDAEFQRNGRSIPLSNEFRSDVLKGLRKWEEMMDCCGLIDSVGIAQELAMNLNRIECRYRCVLVDEVQDFGSVELQIIRAVATQAENDLFLCGDAAQAVTTKHQSFKEAGISDHSTRSRTLNLNYRNSRDVLDAAHKTLLRSMTEEMLDREDLEILDPEYSAFSDTVPLLAEGRSLAHEIGCAFSMAGERIADDESAKVCIAFCGFTLFELTEYGKIVGLPVLDGTTSMDAGPLFLSDLEQTKGFEFDTVIVVNCSAGTFPDQYAPEDERFRDLARLYVAMTRARKQLVVSFSGEPSAFFGREPESFLHSTWSEYVADSAILPTLQVPRTLDDLRDGSFQISWREMTGEQFLRTPDARGASNELIKKIRLLADGRGLIHQKSQKRFRTIGEAALAWHNVPLSRQLWGPSVGAQFEALTRTLATRDNAPRRRVKTPIVARA